MAELSIVCASIGYHGTKFGGPVPPEDAASVGPPALELDIMSGPTV